MLEVVDLVCERDDRVLFAHLSFALSPGETLQIEGGNGTGKTTLLRSIAGLSLDYEGCVFWRGTPQQKNYTDFLLNSCFLGHRSGVKPELTPLENLSWQHQLSGRRELMSVQDALVRANLAGYEDIPCYQLSAGQHRRVALAGLLLSRAMLWILDEPFTAIDAEGVNWLESLIEEHACQQGMTLITSHQPLSGTIKNVKQLQLENYSPGASHEY